MNVDATKIKVGDKVRLRNGDVLTVTVVNLLDHPTYPVEVCWVGSGYAYTRDGVYWEGEEDPRDIVEIIPAEASEKPTQDKMTLRDQFAMAALSALLQGLSTKSAVFRIKSEESIGKDAYFFADKMMQARKENN